MMDQQEYLKIFMIDAQRNFEFADLDILTSQACFHIVNF